MPLWLWAVPHYYSLACFPIHHSRQPHNSDIHADDSHRTSWPPSSLSPSWARLEAGFLRNALPCKGFVASKHSRIARPSRRVSSSKIINVPDVLVSQLWMERIARISQCAAPACPQLLLAAFLAACPWEDVGGMRGSIRHLLQSVRHLFVALSISRGCQRSSRSLLESAAGVRGRPESYALPTTARTKVREAASCQSKAQAPFKCGFSSSHGFLEPLDSLEGWVVIFE